MPNLKTKKNSDITIWGLGEISRRLAVGPADFNIVSIRSSCLSPSEYDAFEKYRSNYNGIIVEHFDDIQSPEPGWIVPGREHIQRILGWTLGMSKIAVHCTAGISRSPAVAYLIACQRSPPREALQVLDPMMHFPNRLIISLGAEAMGDESILSEYNRWYRDEYRIFGL